METLSVGDINGNFVADTLGATFGGEGTLGQQSSNLRQRLRAEALIALEEGGTEGAPRGLNGPKFG